MASIQKRDNGKWRARYRDEAGKEHARHFARKVDAQRWLDETTASLVTGQYVSPTNAKTTVRQWCDTWLKAYEGRRSSTYKAGRTHVRKIVEGLGDSTLKDLRPSEIKAWCAQLATEGASPSYVYALHSRLSQILDDAVHDKVLATNPCSRRTAPPSAKQRPFVASTEQVWALYDRFPDHLKKAVLLAAFAGLRNAEICGLRTADVDFMRGIVNPTVQYPAEPLKTDASMAPIPIPRELAVMLAVEVSPDGWVVETPFSEQVGPWMIQREIRAVREELGLPEGFRLHDLRHYYASMLIAGGADVKVVQARLRHEKATTTLNTYSHLWPDTEEKTRELVSAVLRERPSQSAHSPQEPSKDPVSLNVANIKNG